MLRITTQRGYGPAQGQAPKRGVTRMSCQPPRSAVAWVSSPRGAQSLPSHRDLWAESGHVFKAGAALILIKHTVASELPW